MCMLDSILAMSDNDKLKERFRTFATRQNLKTLIVGGLGDIDPDIWTLNLPEEHRKKDYTGETSDITGDFSQRTTLLQSNRTNKGNPPAKFDLIIFENLGPIDILTDDKGKYDDDKPTILIGNLRRFLNSGGNIVLFAGAKDRYYEKFMQCMQEEFILKKVGEIDENSWKFEENKTQNLDRTFYGEWKKE